MTAPGLWRLKQGAQGGGEKRSLYSEKSEETRGKRKIKVFCCTFNISHNKKEENFL